MSDNQLSRRLRNYEVRSKNLCPNHSRSEECKGYHLADLSDVWRRYLPPLSEKPVAAVAAVASGQFQGFFTTAAVPEPVANNVEPSHPSAENPQKPGLATVTTATTAFPGNGDDAPGLSWRAIDQITHEVEAWAYGRRHKGEIDQDDLEAEIRRRLAAAGIFPEVVEFEADRVLRCLFEGREAVRMPEAGNNDLSIPEILRR